MVRDEICLSFKSVGRFSGNAASGAVIVEYVTYGPVLNHFNFVNILFLPRVPYNGRIFN